MKTTAERFWGYVIKTSECWEWTAYRNETGYGIIRVDHRPIRAHRFSWELHHGKIPRGKCVLHRCDNPPCVRPEHLFLGTQKDNLQDMSAKKRFSNRTGVNNPNSTLTEETVKRIRESKLSNRKAAKLFPASQAHIGRIRRREVWPHI